MAGIPKETEKDLVLQLVLRNGPVSVEMLLPPGKMFLLFGGRPRAGALKMDFASAVLKSDKRVLKRDDFTMTQEFCRSWRCHNRSRERLGYGTL